MKFVPLNKESKVKQAALVDECDGIRLIEPKEGKVFVSKNGGPFKERDSKEPIYHAVTGDVTTLVVPLSEKDTDTLGQCFIYVEEEKALLSTGVVEIVDSFK